MRKAVEVQGADVVVEIKRVRSRDHLFTVSVFSAKGRVPDYADELYSEPARYINDAFTEFNRLVSTLKKGRFPWEIDDE